MNEAGDTSDGARPTGSTPEREPLVLPLAPRRGWAAADGPRRVFAVGCVLTVVAALASTVVRTGSWDTSAVAAAFTVVVVLAGPPMCYSLARVLRPHPPGVGWERRWRHWAAAVATAYGSSILGSTATVGESGDRWWLFDAPHQLDLLFLVQASAAVIGPVTVVWGVLALVWRAVDARWPGRLSTAGFVRIDDDAEAEDARIAAHRDPARAP